LSPWHEVKCGQSMSSIIPRVSSYITSSPK